MDTFDGLLTTIITRIQVSSLPDEKKADIYAEISLGMHKLTWSVLMSHIPEEKLKSIVSQSQITVSQYADIIDAILQDPTVSKEVHIQIMEALSEVDDVLTKNNIPKFPKETV